MSTGFNADEVFEMALDIERQGVRFYTAASELFTDQQIKNMLLGLARMEKEHEKVFSSLREDLVGEEPYSNAYDPDGVAASYLSAMTDGAVFGGELTLTGSETLEEIMKKGIDAEKNSIIFYTGLKGVVSKDLGRAKVEKIIEEEMKHVVLLSNTLASLKG